ncbi:MAG: thiamine diphosphokinase [Anaerolineales bacterium]|nr:thiamine diphosphokinase [Anaerolineales bacterium]
MKRAIIFANGELPEPAAVRGLIQPDDLLIAADGGARHCRALGLTPHLVIGDFDSLDAAELGALEQAGATLRQHPRDKDETDLELALLEAAARGASYLVVLGAFGGRLDMTLANIQLLLHPKLAGVRVELRHGAETARLIRPPGGVIAGAPGDTVSLLPLDGDASGIVTHGLRYPLRGEALVSGPARGVSNVLIEPQAHITLTNGRLLIIHSAQRS